MAANDAQLDRIAEMADRMRVLLDQMRDEMQALRGGGKDAQADDLYGWFCEQWRGPLEANLWQDFPLLVQGHEADLRANLEGWLRSERYRSGFHAARSFLRSGVWHRPAPQAIAPVPRKQVGPRNPWGGGAA